MKKLISKVSEVYKEAPYRLQMKSRVFAYFDLVFITALILFITAINITAPAKIAFQVSLILVVYIMIVMFSLFLLLRGKYDIATLIIAISLSLGQLFRMGTSDFNSEYYRVISSSIHYFSIIALPSGFADVRILFRSFLLISQYSPAPLSIMASCKTTCLPLWQYTSSLPSSWSSSSTTSCSSSK